MNLKMADIKWIKINVSMFDDEKIKFIETLPEADTILVIWMKLLTQTGKCNAGGYVMLTENIPYTDEMLSSLFNRPLNTVRLALDTFKRLGMIEWDENGIEVANWTKHQNNDALEKIRESNRLRQQKHRQKKMGLLGGAAEIPFKEIVAYLNEKANKRYKWTSEKTKKSIRARWNEGFRLEDFQKVVDNKTAAWMGGNMEAYLRPETLFGTKFEGYLNESGTVAAPRNDFDDFLND
jgi:predicted phage replisome organizer/uncharacterized phage protein (TIGR02220 family)